MRSVFRRSCVTILGLMLASFVVGGDDAQALDMGEVGAATAGQGGAARSGVRAGYSIFEGTLVDLSWPEVKAAAEAGAIVIVPIGAIEEHGPHMSLGADAYLTSKGCQLLRRKLEQSDIQAVIAPPMYWGVFQPDETGGYPGSFGVQPATMKALLMDLLGDLKRAGFRRVYLANLHGDRQHRRTIDEAAAEARQSLGLDVYDERAVGATRPRIEVYRVEKPFQPDFHAGAVETREMLEHFPEEVNTEIARTLPPQGTFHPRGYVGDPASYDNATGTMLTGIVDAEVENIARWVKAGPRQSPDDAAGTVPGP